MERCPMGVHVAIAAADRRRRYSARFDPSWASPMTSTLKETTSVCAHCLERVAAVVVERDGQVFLRKSCPVHGDEEALLASDARLLAAHAQREPALVGVLTPNAPHRRHAGVARVNEQHFLKQSSALTRSVTIG